MENRAVPEKTNAIYFSASERGPASAGGRRQPFRAAETAPVAPLKIFGYWKLFHAGSSVRKPSVWL